MTRSNTIPMPQVHLANQKITLKFKKNSNQIPSPTNTNTNQQQNQTVNSEIILKNLDTIGQLIQQNINKTIKVK